MDLGSKQIPNIPIVKNISKKSQKNQKNKKGKKKYKKDLGSKLIPTFDVPKKLQWFVHAQMEHVNHVTD